MCPDCKCTEYKVKFVFKHLRTTRVECCSCRRLYYLDSIDKSNQFQQRLPGVKDD